jgi:hypothetical protein
MLGHEPGLMMTGVCKSIRPRLDREVLAAIDGLGPGQWRHRSGTFSQAKCR